VTPPQLMRSSHRLDQLLGFSIDQVASDAGSDPGVLRLENLDTDLRPPPEAIEATRAALDSDEANSYLPFTGREDLRHAIAQRLQKQTGIPYTERDVVITCGATEGILDALLASTDPGDEVILTDPIYAGIINRVRLAGAVPRFVPLLVEHGEWRLDVGALGPASTPNTRALLAMSPSMPSGAVLDRAEWDAIADLCRRESLWLIYNAATERILFDGRPQIHPAALPGMAERTITIGSVSKEFRMIGWRVGWVAARGDIVEKIARVHIYNVVTPIGIAQAGALAALRSSPADAEACVLEWQARRDTVLQQLADYPVVRPGGGWCLLLDTAAMGFEPAAASKLLLDRGRVAATPMQHWGQTVAPRYLRLVFSNEPVSRLATLRERFRRAFDQGC